MKSLSCLLSEIRPIKDDVPWRFWQIAIFLHFGDASIVYKLQNQTIYLFIFQENT